MKVDMLAIASKIASGLETSHGINAEAAET
jgi:hypothetical protein